MAVIVFESATQEQAAGFRSADTVAFGNGSTASAVMAVASDANGQTQMSITLTYGGKSLVFPATELSTASQAGRIAFADNTSLVLGTAGANTLGSGTMGAAGTTQTTIYGFEGDDTLNGSPLADNLFGGIGADTIIGGGGNDRIYGNSIQNLTASGTTDGVDSLLGGAGGDYIQGNAGSDIIDGGADSDRLFGGSGNDSILGGEGIGNDTINGNQGNDTIVGGGGDDFLRGGQNDDSILGGDDNDQIFGDAGNDTITGGAGLDILTGGAGTNTFTFGAGDSTFTTQGGDFANITDRITDFKLDTDALVIGTFNNVVKDNAATFTSVEFARTYAQGLLLDTGDANSVAAVQVGTSTYIFFSSGAASTDIVNSAIRLDNINVVDVTTSSLF